MANGLEKIARQVTDELVRRPSIEMVRPPSGKDEFTYWLDGRLRAERDAIGTELEKRHNTLLSDCAQWYGKSAEQHVVSFPTRDAEATTWRSEGSGGGGAKSEVLRQVSPSDLPPNPLALIKTKDPSRDSFGGVSAAMTATSEEGAQPSVERTSTYQSERSSIAKDLSLVHDISKKITADSSKRSHGIFDVTLDAKSVSWTRKLASSREFELTFGVVIVVSALVMGLECQYHSYTFGRDSEYPGFTETSEQAFPGVKPVFAGLDVAIGLLFVVEVVIKLLGFRLAFFRDAWSIFDLVITTAWSIDVFVSTVELPINPSLLRIARSARLFRLLKVLRALASLDHLFIMTTTLRASMGLLFWAVVLMVVVQTMFAFLVNQIIVTHYATPSTDPEVRIEIFKYFGTFSRAMFSMFEITLGNWGPVARILVEHVSTWFMLFTLFHKLTIGFAVLGIVNGIFIQETFKVAACDDHVLLLQKDREARWLRKKMTALFKLADTSNDGRVDEEELRIILGNSQIKKWLGTQGFATGGCYIDRFCKLVCQEESLSLEDFLEGVDKLKGAARSIDLALLSHQHMMFEDQIFGMFEKLLEQGHPRSDLKPDSPLRHAGNGSKDRPTVLEKVRATSPDTAKVQPQPPNVPPSPLHSELGKQIEELLEEPSSPGPPVTWNAARSSCRLPGTLS